jgi:hypothetical protein
MGLTYRFFFLCYVWALDLEKRFDVLRRNFPFLNYLLSVILMSEFFLVAQYINYGGHFVFFDFGKRELHAIMVIYQRKLINRKDFLFLTIY